MTHHRRRSAVVGLVVAVLAAVSGVASVVSGPTTAAAADLSGFRPGNIISDKVFFAGDWWDASSVQQFLAQKGANCSIGADGSPCLKDYRVDTPSRAADARCTGGYAGAAGELASTIIAKVGLSCGINPQVIIVMLQKEQGLVTTGGAAATASRYQKAMGYGCPDTSVCDSQYYGFFNQVYQAAWQFRNYALNPTRFGYRAGLTNQVLYNPNTACGSSGVYIENQATAGLYNYTPYQPNAAALAAGYGTGDSCSSYGNRNFWNYFTDWFGPTYGYGVSPQMMELWTANGGPRGPFGVPIAEQRCDLAPTGCSQEFSNVTVYWSPGTGAEAVGGIIRARYQSSGAQGAIGYPKNTVLACDPAQGCVQSFEAGAITWSGSTGAQLVGGLIFARWVASGGMSSGMGYPTDTVLACDAAAGCAQHFQNGLITWSGGTGAQAIGGLIGQKWQSLGAEKSWLGYPNVTTLACDPAGCIQTFAGGLITWSAATGAQTMPVSVAQTWLNLGGLTAGIGLPLESKDPSCGGGAECLQRFQSGVMSFTPRAGARLVGGLIYTAWWAAGGAASPLRYPTSIVQGCDPAGCVQTFDNGAGVWSAATGAQLITGPLWDRWKASGAMGAGLGLPTQTVLTCAAPGCTQAFQNGAATWSPTAGAQLTGGLIGALWTKLGGAASPLGYPTSTVLACDAATGCTQLFEHGAIRWTVATGAQVVAPA